MTMVAGEVRYCAAGHASFCPSTGTSETSQDLPTGANLALNQSVTASNSLSGNAELAVDGDESTHWGAGDFASQWIEIDLGATATITELRLLVSQSPDGETDHSIYVRAADEDFVEVYRFTGFTADGDWLVFTSQEPLKNVRVIRIQTSASPSWVSWSEIKVFGKKQNCPTIRGYSC